MQIKLTQERSFTVRAGANAVHGLFHVGEWKGLTAYEDAHGRSLILDGESIVKASPELLSFLTNGDVEPGFVIVPETTLPCGRVVPTFRVAQHVASKGDDGTISISATGQPWVEINFADAKQVCTDAGYACITETQWLAIVYNASQQDENWTGGKVGHGSMFQGIRNGGGARPGNYQPTDETEQRWLVLSNGSRVCDFNGNVFQWVFDDVQGDEKGLIAQTLKLDSISHTTAPFPSEQKGMGWRPDGDRNWSGRALLRGGCFGSYGIAGVFGLGLDFPGDGSDYVGVRCTKPGI